MPTEGQQHFSSSITGKQYLLPEENLFVTIRKNQLLIYNSLKIRHYKHRQQLRQKTEGIGHHFNRCGGYKNFQLSIIEAVTKPDTLKEREVWWTKELKTMYPLGMNVRDEGASGTNTKKKSDATKLKKGLKRL